MKPLPSPQLPLPRDAFRSMGGYALVECLVYISLLAIVSGLAFAAFYRVWDNSNKLNRHAADILRALNAGERWRADIRSSVAAPQLAESGGQTILRLPQAKGEIHYAFKDGTVFRKAEAASTWHALLPQVNSSHMQAEPRSRVSGWRWEIELKALANTPRVRPLFTFQAVTGPPKP